MKKAITTEKAPAAIGPYSQAVDAGDYLYVSGQIPLDTEGKIVGNDIQTQSSQVFKNIEAILEAAGLGLGNIVRCQVLLTNLDDFSKLNEIYKQAFQPHGTFPARTVAEVSRLPKGVMIMVDAIAIKT